MRVAIIPARGGSKRIPRKNVREFAGRPMIAWSIDAVRRSGCFDRIVVSTDDDAVAAVAEAWGAEVPFRRPAELSDDRATTLPVVAHAVRWLRDAGSDVAVACCVYATAPMLRPDDLARGAALVAADGVDYAFACTTFPFPVHRALRLDAAGRLEMLFPEHERTRSQDLPEVFHDAGQFYWGRAEAWLEGRPVYGPRSVPVMIPRERVQDIDTPEDWARAEVLHRVLAEVGRR